MWFRQLHPWSSAYLDYKVQNARSKRWAIIMHVEHDQLLWWGKLKNPEPSSTLDRKSTLGLKRENQARPLLMPSASWCKYFYYSHSRCEYILQSIGGKKTANLIKSFLTNFHLFYYHGSIRLSIYQMVAKPLLAKRRLRAVEHKIV